MRAPADGATPSGNAATTSATHSLYDAGFTLRIESMAVLTGRVPLRRMHPVGVPAAPLAPYASDAWEAPMYTSRWGAAEAAALFSTGLLPPPAASRLPGALAPSLPLFFATQGSTGGAYTNDTRLPALLVTAGSDLYLTSDLLALGSSSSTGRTALLARGVPLPQATGWFLHCAGAAEAQLGAAGASLSTAWAAFEDSAITSPAATSSPPLGYAFTPMSTVYQLAGLPASSEVQYWRNAGSATPTLPSDAVHAFNITGGPGALFSLLPGGTLRAGYIYTLTASVTLLPRWSWSAASLPYVTPAAGPLADARAAFLPGIPLPSGLGATTFYRTRNGRLEPGGGPWPISTPASPLPAFTFTHLPPLQTLGGFAAAEPFQGGVALTTGYNITTTGWATALDDYVLSGSGARELGAGAAALQLLLTSTATLPPPVVHALAVLAGAGAGVGAGAGAGAGAGEASGLLTKLASSFTTAALGGGAYCSASTGGALDASSTSIPRAAYLASASALVTALGGANLPPATPPISSGNSLCAALSDAVILLLTARMQPGSAADAVGSPSVGSAIGTLPLPPHTPLMASLIVDNSPTSAQWDTYAPIWPFAPYSAAGALLPSDLLSSSLALFLGPSGNSVPGVTIVSAQPSDSSALPTPPSAFFNFSSVILPPPAAFAPDGTGRLLLGVLIVDGEGAVGLCFAQANISAFKLPPILTPENIAELSASITSTCGAQASLAALTCSLGFATSIGEGSSNAASVSGSGEGPVDGEPGLPALLVDQPPTLTNASIALANLASGLMSSASATLLVLAGGGGRGGGGGGGGGGTATALSPATLTSVAAGLSSLATVPSSAACSTCEGSRLSALSSLTVAVGASFSTGVSSAGALAAAASATGGSVLTAVAAIMGGQVTATSLAAPATAAWASGGAAPSISTGGAGNANATSAIYSAVATILSAVGTGAQVRSSSSSSSSGSSSAGVGAAAVSYCGPAIVAGSVALTAPLPPQVLTQTTSMTKKQAAAATTPLSILSPLSSCLPANVSLRPLLLSPAQLAAVPPPALLAPSTLLASLHAAMPGGLPPGTGFAMQLTQFGVSPVNETVGHDDAVYKTPELAGAGNSSTAAAGTLTAVAGGARVLGSGGAAGHYFSRLLQALLSLQPQRHTATSAVGGSVNASSGSSGASGENATSGTQGAGAGSPPPQPPPTPPRAPPPQPPSRMLSPLQLLQRPQPRPTPLLTCSPAAPWTPACSSFALQP